MFHLYYIIPFVLFLLFTILSFSKKNVLFILLTITCAIVFIFAVNYSHDKVNEAFERDIENTKKMTALSNADPNIRNAESKQDTSSYQQELADTEKQILSGYAWDKKNIDIIDGLNGSFARAAMQSVVFYLIAHSYNYEAFDSAERFKKIIDNPEKYIGAYIEIIGQFESRLECTEQDLLNVFPPLQNNVLLQEIITLSGQPSAHILVLYYWPTSVVGEYIDLAYELERASQYTTQGCFIGTYHHDAIDYYVIVTN